MFTATSSQLENPSSFGSKVLNLSYLLQSLHLKILWAKRVQISPRLATVCVQLCLCCQGLLENSRLLHESYSSGFRSVGGGAPIFGTIF